MWPFLCYGFSVWSYSLTWLKNLLTIPVSSLVVDPLLTFMRTYTYPKLRFYCILVSQHAIFMHLFLCPYFLSPLLESASITGPAITHPHCLVLDESLFRTLKLKRYSGHRLSMACVHVTTVHKHFGKDIFQLSDLRLA